EKGQPPPALISAETAVGILAAENEPDGGLKPFGDDLPKGVCQRPGMRGEQRAQRFSSAVTHRPAMSAVAEAPAAVNGIARFARAALKLALFLGAVEKAIRAPNQRSLLAGPSHDCQHGEGGVPRGRARSGKANAVLGVIPAPALDASEAWRKRGILRIV